MAITINSQPDSIHSSGNYNWWQFSSDLRFASKFNLVVNIYDEADSLFNSVTLPTNPDNLNVLNISNIINDYVEPDFNPFITTWTASTCIEEYYLEVKESFAGLYISDADTHTSQIATVSISNNTVLKTIATPSFVKEIGFVGGDINNAVDSVWVYSFGTASDGYINSVVLTQNPTQSIPVTASVGTNSEGYLVLEDYDVYSYGTATTSVTKTAVLSNIDYLSYDDDDNFGDYFMMDSSGKFLTRSPRTLNIQSTEYATLSLLQSTTHSLTAMVITGVVGGVATMSITASDVRIDIPAGPANLESLDPNETQYTIHLYSTSSVVSETFTYNITCLSGRSDVIRLCWLNSLGGIDYYSFRFIEQHTKRIERNNFNKNLLYTATKQSRGQQTYKLNDYDEYVVATDPLDATTLDWLSDLSTSNDVYWIRSGELIPIVIVGDTHNYDAGWDNYELKINFRLSRTNYK